MDVGLLEIIVGLIATGIGWLHLRQSNLESLLAEKVDQSDFNELKVDVRSISDTIVELKVDQTRCLTILENLERINSRNGLN